uniref:Uncharacterized protein n=1 Tax=Timspurckia oligopyrenoides TaxID=708627 RepID=A0A7S0ZGT4_9RHOD|mmetsp:Transcript_4608/g.8046  ORF Transcript_4608/g.8046 Transcript_4608/m.8046 type:complete len:253 (+) Transcript_4608:80-838(+)|eukprot:CAMPEP_0182447042 /NCGR_PEP_ID=MMETSP1172-20130603/10692_1 /TAXON_ID=708627 /ORGANISM="Timspurckia oligopyrenoides, Strain CCMP3278" /LENGTH=252 /DNA_ID=CAMNT_0024643309 /DNA_START=128 /DNA_END=886 /DNA_ORIENTATION=-
MGDRERRPAAGGPLSPSTTDGNNRPMRQLSLRRRQEPPPKPELQMGQGMPASSLPSLYRDPVTGAIMQEAPKENKATRQMSLRRSRNPEPESNSSAVPPPAAENQATRAVSLRRGYKDPEPNTSPISPPAAGDNRATRTMSLRRSRPDPPKPELQIGQGMPATSLPTLYRDPVTGAIMQEAPKENKPMKTMSLRRRPETESAPASLQASHRGSMGMSSPKASAPASIEPAMNTSGGQKEKAGFGFWKKKNKN